MKRTRVMMAADALSNFMEQHSEQLYQYNELCREAREGVEVERGGKLVKVVNVDLLHFAYKTYKPFVRQYMVLKYELDQARYEEARYKKATTIVDPNAEPDWVKELDPAAAEGFYHPDRIAPVSVVTNMKEEATPVSLIVPG